MFSFRPHGSIQVSRWNRFRWPLSVGCRKQFATVSPQMTNVPMSRFEQESFINYDRMESNLQIVRDRLRRPLTYAEKILYSHLDNPLEADIIKGESYLKLRPDRIACQDATAQMALIQFMSAQLDSVAVPTTVHVDHLIVGKKGNVIDLPKSNEVNKEVFDFLASVCQKYNIGFWKAGAGIIHQVILENYAFPGGLMIGTDSHSPNAGGLAMGAIGVGGADAVDVMAGLAWELKAPKVIGVRLTGSLSGWTAPKDIILKIAGELTVRGGTGHIIEYFGPGVDTLSCTGMASVCNMGAETGATTSIFPYTKSMGKYLTSTRRDYLRKRIEGQEHNFMADSDAEYDQILELDLSRLEPHINGPMTPDLSTSNSLFKNTLSQNNWPTKLSAGLIGSCTNSSYEDMTRAASIAAQALDAGIKPKIPLFISVGSEQTRSTLENEGILDAFTKSGATMLANACGPCSGSWDREDVQKGTRNSIINSYNRNFTGRLDGSPSTHIFIASPEMVMAKTIAGDLNFDPIRDTLMDSEGNPFSFRPPQGDSLPSAGYNDADAVYTAPSGNRSQHEVNISETSDRIQRLVPFAPWDGNDFHDLPILIKVKGKCTTDHITPAGPWFKYRGHLENISNNTLIGAVNAANDKVNSIRNVFTGLYAPVPETAKDYKQRGQQWVIIGDYNYGEGSSREHAALQPRYLNGVAVIARSFARIHETNLKKQGMLPLIFKNELDYDRITAEDRISLTGLGNMSPGSTVKMIVRGKAGEWTCELAHSFNSEQVGFFKAGSALNLITTTIAVP